MWTYNEKTVDLFVSQEENIIQNMILLDFDLRIQSPELWQKYILVV